MPIWGTMAKLTFRVLQNMVFMNCSLSIDLRLLIISEKKTTTNINCVFVENSQKSQEKQKATNESHRISMKPDNTENG